MPNLPTVYPGLPTRPISVLPLYPAALSPDEPQGALCHIFVKVLASFSATPEAWVAWGPASAMASSLQVLGLTPQADATWHQLLTRGWVEKHYIYDSFSFRLTPLGISITLLPPPPLPTAPAWYHAVLKHLYPSTPP